jgi:2-phospho-L-lactate/phosphoenolpyruvate guanylyltransferase
MHVLIAVKRFDEAKSRLSPRLASSQRADIAMAMLEDLLSELVQVRGLTGVSIVTSQPRLKSRIARFANVLRDPGTGLNGALTFALSALGGRGESRVLVIHSDLPLARANDLQNLVDTHRHAKTVVVVPDAAGTGTNALVCSLPLAFALQFGPGSLAGHRRAATLQGLPCIVATVPCLALDVDEPGALDDVEAMAVSLGAHAAPHTQALLARWRQRDRTLSRCTLGGAPAAAAAGAA